MRSTALGLLLIVGGGMIFVGSFMGTLPAMLAALFDESILINNPGGLASTSGVKNTPIIPITGPTDTTPNNSNNNQKPSSPSGGYQIPVIGGILGALSGLGSSAAGVLGDVGAVAPAAA